MKRFVSLLIVCAMGCCLLGGCSILGNRAEELTKNAEALSIDTDLAIEDGPGVDESLSGTQSVNNFSYNLFEQSLEMTNPVMSPVSAYFAMGMIGAGAFNETLQEIEAVLGTDMLEVSDDLMDSLPADEEDLQVQIANSVWVDDMMNVDDYWLSVVKGPYQSEAYKIDLDGGSTLGSINSWAKEKTNGLIDSILDEPLSEYARLALVNAIYFDGKWVSTFEGERTNKEAFSKEDGTTVEVDMMRSYWEYFPYVSEDGYDGVVLPYRDGSYAFVALKPTEGQTVREMYAGFTMEELCQVVEDREDTFVYLKLPKFEAAYDKVLNKDLINLGMASAFDPDRADFSGLGTSEDGFSTYIELVRQKAVIKVDEEGTEAAAVTIAVDSAGSAAPIDEPIEVFFDEPFFYMIYDIETGVPLFMGIMDDPTIK